MLLSNPMENWMIPIAIALSFGCVHLMIINIPPTSDVEWMKTVNAKIAINMWSFVSHRPLSQSPFVAVFCGAESSNYFFKLNLTWIYKILISPDMHKHFEKLRFPFSSDSYSQPAWQAEKYVSPSPPQIGANCSSSQRHEVLNAPHGGTKTFELPKLK